MSKRHQGADAGSGLSSIRERAKLSASIRCNTPSSTRAYAYCAGTCSRIMRLEWMACFN